MIINCRINGITPLLQHRYSDNNEVESSKDSRPIKFKKMLPRAQAEEACNRDGNGYCYFVGAAIFRLLRESGSFHKMKTTKRSLKYIIPSAVLVPEDIIYILSGSPPQKTKEFEVDLRSVVIPSTKGRIMRYRPRWDQWSAEFSLEIDETVLSSEEVHLLLEEGGRRIGIGDYRPEKGGPFGRFEINLWNVRP